MLAEGSSSRSIACCSTERAMTKFGSGGVWHELAAETSRSRSSDAVSARARGAQSGQVRHTRVTAAQRESSGRAGINSQRLAESRPGRGEGRERGRARASTPRGFRSFFFFVQQPNSILNPLRGAACRLSTVPHPTVTCLRLPLAGWAGEHPHCSALGETQTAPAA
jgi:hypothetical protein